VPTKKNSRVRLQTPNRIRKEKPEFKITRYYRMLEYARWYAKLSGNLYL
jgi:hypothetical protein